MIEIQLFPLSLLLQLILASFTLPLNLTAGRTIIENNSSSSMKISHTLMKRAHDARLVEPIIESKAFSNWGSFTPASGFPDHNGLAGKTYYSIQKSSRAPATSDEELRIESVQKDHQSIHDTLAQLEQKELRSMPTNLQILSQRIKQLASRQKPFHGILMTRSGFEMHLLELLFKCFEVEKAEWWFPLFDSWHSLNTNYWKEINIIFKMSHLITTTSGPPTKEEIAKSIAQCTSKYYPRLGLSGVDPTLRGSQLKLGKLYEFTTNSISAGIWKFSLPIEDGKFDVEYLKRNPIARLSWFLEDLDAEEMMKYAQAFQEPEIGITIPQMVARQTILEQPDKTDPREQFAASRWFLQHVGWDCFQKTMLEYEKFPSGNRKIKGKVFRNPQRSNREKSSPSQGVQGFWRNKLDSILKENSFPQLPEQDQFSENIMEWLANFLTWLNKSNVQVRRLPSLKIS